MAAEVFMHLSRRDFSRLSALTAVSAALPRLHAQDDAPQTAGRQLGWCIVGLGRISMEHFMPAVADSKAGKLTALVSGHREKAEKQAAQYNIPSPSIYSYENFDEIRDNKDIDAVYIALPNSMHAEYTIRAAKAGKHVLCEKPMATSLADCRAMIEACKTANVKLMIAYRCQYKPSTSRPSTSSAPARSARSRSSKLPSASTSSPASGASTRSSPAAARSWMSASTASTPSATSPAKSRPKSRPIHRSSITTAASKRLKRTMDGR